MDERVTRHYCHEMSFRFETLGIWKRSADISIKLFEIANELDQRKWYRSAEQLRAAALSITNNIAEGSGSFSNAEFAQFLNFSRRSIFETANILMMISRDRTIELPIEPLLTELDEISRMISTFRRTLKA